MKKTKSILPDWVSISKLLTYKEKDFQKLLDSFVKNKKEIYDKVKAIKKEVRTFKNTILAIENSNQNFSNTFYQFGVFAMTCKDKKFRDSIGNFHKILSEHMIDLEHNKDIHQAITEYYQGNYKQEKNNLDKKYGTGSVKLIEEMVKEYQRMGFELSAKEQTKLKKLSKEITKYTIDFAHNLDEYRDFILCSKKEIKGLPENFVKSLEKVNGKYKITLDYPSYLPFIKYADSRSKRKEITDKNYRKGGAENLKLLTKIVKLRGEMAKLLGYKNYVEFSTEDRMSKNEKTVRNFLTSLIRKLSRSAKKDLEDLNNFAKSNLEEYKILKKIEYYDIAYVANKLEESKYSYDTSKLKEYFELEHTLKTMFNIFGNLFNFTVSEVKAREKQSILVDKSLRLYEFKDKKIKEVLSYLILDLFPRAGKYGHACSADFINEENRDGQRIIPIDEVICNFSKASKKIPSLLSLEEVSTLFHEFGHALHYMLTHATYGSQAGCNVVFDFVETPSQMLENFLFTDENLCKLGIHYKTGKILDKETRHKVIQSKNFLNSYSYLRQSIQSIYDLDLHTGKIKDKDLAKYYRDLLKLYFDFNLSRDTLFPAGFGHMASGYGAGCYSYLWALVYAKDIYSVFAKAKTNRELNRIGARYRQEILEVGGSRKELDSVKKFLQRNPNSQAFFNDLQST